ncbi:uncharacterized protein LOC128557875 [Mercenaria mercenaria]|uniref:uncharacterized protein LOC128557875 n=1 Tax=Mercenaria mercenaria TaxID=6596 RepID=UPI00234F3B69|nr:uncharacterized protein LOC128557875 [Mercenaria mercenaria]
MVTPAPKVEDTLPKKDAIIAIVVCGLIIVMLAILAAVLICRNMRNKPSLLKDEGTASYHKGPAKSEESRGISRASSVNESYIRPKLNDTTETGHINPMYSSTEPLPAVSHYDLAKDKSKSVMSYDRWMQERQHDY